MLRLPRGLVQILDGAAWGTSRSSPLFLQKVADGLAWAQKSVGEAQLGSDEEGEMLGFPTGPRWAWAVAP